MGIETLFTTGTPVVPIRAVHLDLKGTPPTPERFLGLLKLFAACRYNAVLVEWEDTFPWTVDERFRSETAYSPQDVEKFHAAAGELGIEMIPLVQCLGHAETPLSVPSYRAMREVAHRSDVLNPLAPGARELIQKMVDDVLARTPGARHFHLGGDEAWTFGTHPDTRAYVGKHGKGALYLHHVEPILDCLNARGVRPMLWDDMMREWPEKELRRLSGKADLVVWAYTHQLGEPSHRRYREFIERFQASGVTLWGAAAYKGADGHNSDLPDLSRRQANALAWADLAQRYGLKGVIATAWSRYSTHHVQDEPIDAALDCLLNVGVILHDGKAPGGGAEACLAGLEEIGEKTRFQACREALRKLSDARGWAWRTVWHLREQLVMETLDARRREAGTAAGMLKGLRKNLAAADSAAVEARAAFGGLVEPVWIERYLAERIEPLREELGELEPRVRQLEPVSYLAEGS